MSLSPYLCNYIDRAYIAASLSLYRLTSAGMKAACSSSIARQLTELFACSNLRLDGRPWLVHLDSPRFYYQPSVLGARVDGPYSDKQFVDLHPTRYAIRVSHWLSVSQLQTSFNFD